MAALPEPAKTKNIPITNKLGEFVYPALTVKFSDAVGKITLRKKTSSVTLGKLLQYKMTPHTFITN